MKISFIYWIIQLLMIFVIQALGNTIIPELYNFGIIIALMFVIAHLYDLQLKGGQH